MPHLHHMFIIICFFFVQSVAKYVLCTKLTGNFFFRALGDTMIFFDLFVPKCYPIKFYEVTEDVFHLYIIFSFYFRDISRMSLPH